MASGTQELFFPLIKFKSSVWLVCCIGQHSSGVRQDNRVIRTTGRMEAREGTGNVGCACGACGACAIFAVFNRAIMSSGAEWHSSKGLKMVREQVL